MPAAETTRLVQLLGAPPMDERFRTRWRRPATDLTRPPGLPPGLLYHFELQMAGVVLLTAMAAGAVSLWLKRRREGAADTERARAEAEERAREVEAGARAGGIPGTEPKGDAAGDDGRPQPNK